MMDTGLVWLSEVKAGREITEDEDEWAIEVLESEIVMETDD